MTVYAQLHSGDGGLTFGIASRLDQPDATWTPYAVPDATWLYLDATGNIAIYTKTQMTAFALQAAIPPLEQAVQVYVDSIAQKKGYDSGISCASYAVSTNVTWATDAKNFIAWRDSVWAYCQSLEAQVLAGTATLPTAAQLIAQLPPAPW